MYEMKCMNVWNDLKFNPFLILSERFLKVLVALVFENEARLTDHDPFAGRLFAIRVEPMSFTTGIWEPDNLFVLAIFYHVHSVVTKKCDG